MQYQSAIPVRFVQKLLVVENELAAVTLLFDQHSHAAAFQLHSPLPQLHIPSAYVRTQRMRLGPAIFAGISVDCQIADAAGIVIGVRVQQAAWFEL